MNIAVQCCGIAVLGILLLFYIQKKTLAIRAERVFRVNEAELLILFRKKGYIQGYYFSKPLSEQHFLEFIKEKNVDQTGGVA